MKRILIVCPHPLNVAPGQRLKYEQYIKSWEENGYQVDISSFMSLRFWNVVYKPGRLVEKIMWTKIGYFRRFLLLFRLRKYDLVYTFLWGTPFGPPIYEWALCKISKKVIYDIDDLVYSKDHKSKANSFIATLKGREKPVYLMKKANHVITCTPHLDNFVRQYTNKTTDISSTINTETYKPINAYSNDKTLTLGWSGSHSTSKYVYLLQDVLLELSKKHKFKLLVIGDASFNIPGLDVEAIGWEEATEVKNLQRIDIGLYPLPDEPWVLGKSGLKALQYMALGIPTIATAIGANYRVIEDGVSGTLVKTNEDWMSALENYINNAELRKAHGKAAQIRVEEKYSIRANTPVYLDIINTVVNSN
mgnify:CR=1 FL=1